MKRYIFLVLLLSAGVAHAQQDYPRDITLSWTNATAYEDGSLIDPGDLTQIRLECFRQNDTVALFNATIPAAGEGLSQSETFTGAIPQPGTYTCYAYSIVFTGAESVASNPAQKKFVGKPNPPVTFTFN